MDEEGAREALDRFIKRSGESYSSVSRLIGRNPAYIQQYVRRGVPSRLEEADLRAIAAALGVAPEAIGGLPPLLAPVVSGADTAGPDDYVRLEVLSRRFLPGPVLPAAQLATLASARRQALAWLTVETDSMAPAFLPGDQLLIDRDDASTRLRDGCYALTIAGEITVRRLSVDPARRVFLVADNAAYPVWPAQDASALDVIGRVVWLSRRLW